MKRRSKTQRVHVTIDRIVLRGFDAGERDAIVAGLEAELGSEISRMAAHGGIGDGRAIASLRLPALRFDEQPRPRQMGASAGRALAFGLGSGSSSLVRGRR